MDDIIPTLDRSKCLKTFSKPDRSSLEPSEKPTSQANSIPNPLREPLTTKNAVKFLLEGNLKSKVCRYCLNIVSQLSELDQILQVADKGVFYKVTIKDIIASFHPFKVVDDPNFPDKICEKCLDRAISSYFFMQQCEQAERALRNCFDDMFEKLDKLDPLERVKKRGRQKINPNYNILYAEHEKVINYADPIIHIVNTASEPLMAQQPINELECLKCCEILPNLESLLNHSKIHPKSMWYNCRLCGTSFPKMQHLKRHFRNAHPSNPAQKSSAEVNKYECNKCGFTNENYYEYLQHIEKHKFKTVMEHLLDNNMDKLCSICLNKEKNMTPLNRTICLHGGTPELTGERSLYRVLSSTLPEKKNKYQELHVSTQATIMQFFKKNKKNESQKGINLSFSNPMIIDVEKLDCDDFYLFLFSEPSNINSVKINEINDAEVQVTKDKIEPKEKPESFVKATDSFANDVQNVMEKSENIRTYQDNPLPDAVIDIQIDELKKSDELEYFKFSNPDLVNLEYQNKINGLEEPQQTTEISIFNQSCLESIKSRDVTKTISIVSNESNIETADAKPCKFCWVFKHSNKCDYCKKPNDRNIKTNDVKAEASNVNTLDTTQGIEKHLVTKVVDKDTRDDEKPWQCNICLIENNKDREICDCCEAKRYKHIENTTFKFSHTKDYKVDTIKNDIVKTPALELIPSFIFKSEELSHQYAKNITSNNNEVFNTQPEDILLMETEMTEAEIPNNFSNSFNEANHNHEAMDFEETQISEAGIIVFPNIDTEMINPAFNDISKTSLARPMNFSNTTNVTDSVSNKIISNITHVQNEPTVTLNNNFMTNQFQFAIGSGEKVPRKYKRAVRNLTRASHK